jgi:stage V sporulation protein G
MSDNDNEHNGLRISEVRITLSSSYDHRNLAAYATFTLNGSFAVRGVRLIAPSPGRLFVSMPSRRGHDGRHINLLFPIDHAGREWIERVLIEAYHRELRRTASDAEWREALDDGRIQPPSSSCGHPTEQVLYETADDAALERAAS